MKKYLMTAMAAVAMGATFTSCSHNTDLYGGGENGETNGRTAEEQAELVKAVYKAAFEQSFGKVAPTVDWGFGSGNSAASTRGTRFTLPTFRNTNPIVKPTVPSGLQNTVPTDAHYAKDYQNYQKGDVIYVNTAYQQLNQPQNFENLTIYVDGNVTLAYSFKQDGGTKIVVTENSTLKLGSMGNGIAVYLAPGATLDITEGFNLDGTPAVDWVWNPETFTTDQVPKTSFTFQNSNAGIYMASGAILQATDLNFVNGAELLNDGGTITANSISLDQNCTAWNDGSFTVNSLTLANTGSCFYNAANKTVTAETISSGNTECLFYNDGIVNASGAITLQNSAAEFINTIDATLTCASYSQAAGGKIHNYGNVSMAGKTDLTNSNSIWQNDGHWTCGSLEASGNDMNGQNNFNNCYLTVNGEFYLNREAFILGSGAGVKCNSFKIDDTSGFYLGNKSVLDISGTLTTEIINDPYGFFAYGSEYAVVKANSIETTTDDPQSINYHGNLLVAINPHLSAEYYTTESSVLFTKDGKNIATIPETNCNPGYVGSDEPEATVYRVICEDLNAEDDSDFDFNDVVFDIIPNKDAEGKVLTSGATIKLICAGGIYHLTVDGVEVHEKFNLSLAGTENGKYPMINTGYDSYPEVEFTTDKDCSTPAKINENIKIYVTKPGIAPIELTAKLGEAAAKVLVDNTFIPLGERVSIKKNKPKFKAYVNGTLTERKWW